MGCGVKMSALTHASECICAHFSKLCSVKSAVFNRSGPHYSRSISNYAQNMLTCKLIHITAKSFNVAEYFNTVPELVDRKYNRPTKEMLKTSQIKSDPEKLQVSLSIYLSIYLAKCAGSDKWSPIVNSVP